MQYRLGVDVGGTFTDIYLLDVDNRRRFTWKVPSTPDDPSRAIVSGVSDLLRQHDLRPQHVTYLAHGTTVATNTIVQHAGARVGMITTRGFRDLLEIARQKRPSVFDLFADKPPVLVPRYLRREVAERVASDGTVISALDQAGLLDSLRELQAQEVEALAVCFLNAYANPVHERSARACVKELWPGVYVSVSHELTSEFREYERFVTTVLNAYVGNTLTRYLQHLRESLHELGLPAEPYIIQSNGGLMSITAASVAPIRTVLSGPSAGVVGAAHEAARAGIANIITLDMGGTSTDVSLLRGGQISTAANQSVAGYPIRVPAVAIHTIGAGGGSVAWIDDAGGFHVGPQSAGAVPGPAAYGIGGNRPTVTDANVLLGRLSQSALLGGRMPIYPELAAQAIGPVAERLSLSAEQAAAGIIQVVVSAMVRAVRVISVEKGEDPRDFSLMAFGGAGALHASQVAKQLGIRTVCIPPAPGLLCSMGALMAVPTMEYSRSRVLASSRWADVRDIFSVLKAEANQWLVHEGVEAAARCLRCSVDMRYVGQNYELTIPLDGEQIGPDELARAVDDFHTEHGKEFGYASPADAVQVVTCRVVATAAGSRLESPPIPPQHTPPSPRAVRSTYFETTGAWLECPVYWRDDLGAGATFQGPTIIEQLDATTVLYPDDAAVIDDSGNILITVGQASEEVRSHA